MRLGDSITYTLWEYTLVTRASTRVARSPWLWCDHNDRSTKNLICKADGKVWKLIANADNSSIDALSIHETLTAKYGEDGFPESWKDSREGPKKIIASFREYARFWYHIVYDSSSGTRIGVHQTDLPADFPKNETEAFERVGRLFKDNPAVDNSLSSSHLPTVQGSRATSIEPPFESQEIDLPNMPTKFPGKIKTDMILAFDGSPKRLLTLDLSVEDICGEHNYPGYYGGTVIGNIDDGYNYVVPGTPNSASNYQFGFRICSAVTARFEGDALNWWEDYRKRGGPKPNCWKRSELTPEIGSTKPDSVTEISLYDILKKYFPEDNDEVEANMELQRFKWNPAVKDAVPFATFRTKVMSLVERSGIVTWTRQVPVIIGCMEPQSLRKEIRLWDDPDKFWPECRVSVNTWLNLHPQAGTKCDTCGGSHETKDCRKPVIRTTKTITAVGNRGDAICDWCNNKGHYKNECNKLKAAISRGEANADERNRRGGPSNQPRPQSSSSARPAQPSGRFNRGTMKCRKCGGIGHMEAICPSRQVALSAANVPDRTNPKDDKDPTSFPSFNMYPRIRVDNVDSSMPTLASNHMSEIVTADEGVDEYFSMLFASKLVSCPLNNNLSKEIEHREVISNVTDVPVEDSAPPAVTTVSISDSTDMSKMGPPVGDVPTGPVWSLASTLRGHDLLTIFDTGAVKAAIPVSTADGSFSSWSTTTPQQISFVKSDGSRYKPAGFCPSFKFRFGSFQFDIQAYVVETAPFQLLLGTEFLWATGAGIFPRWNKLILTTPHRVEIKTSTYGPTRGSSPLPVTEQNTEGDDEQSVDVGVVDGTTTVPFLYMGSSEASGTNCAGTARSGGRSGRPGPGHLPQCRDW
ncbi:hypothetical protein EDC01DRAFT_627780 [Geopyxis carbonaria]|nr:hypothetical protein EDC01DRAFT_627780 [Geopyxis carbonaria]